VNGTNQEINQFECTLSGLIWRDEMGECGRETVWIWCSSDLQTDEGCWISDDKISNIDHVHGFSRL